MNPKAGTYKQKLLLLIAAVLTLLLISYFLSVKKTLALKVQYGELVAKSDKIQSLQEDLQHWSKLNATLDEQLGGKEVFVNFQEGLLAKAGLFCEDHHLVLSDFSEPFTGTERGYQIETIILTIQGNYKPLLQLVHHLEADFHGGRIASAEFNRERNYKRHRDELYLKLYVQNVKKDETES